MPKKKSKPRKPNYVRLIATRACKLQGDGPRGKVRDLNITEMMRAVGPICCVLDDIMGEGNLFEIDRMVGQIVAISNAHRAKLAKAKGNK